MADVEVTGSFIIFTFTVTAVIIGIIYLLVYPDVQIKGLMIYVKAAEFANLVKLKLADSDTLVSYAKLLVVEKEGLSSLGLTQKNGAVKELLIDNEIQIKGEPGDQSHIVYTVIKRDFYPVRDETRTIMRDLATYIVNAYKTADPNMIVDIYPFPPKCAEPPKPESKILSCAEVLSLAEGGAREIKAISELSDIVENGGAEIIRLNFHDIDPADFIEAKNEKLTSAERFIFSDDPLCKAPQPMTPIWIPRMCFRIVGDYVSPATLQTEISDGDTFIG